MPAMERGELLRAIAQAEAAHQASLQESLRPGTSSEKQSNEAALKAAANRLESLRRELGSRFGDEVVVPLELGFHPAAGGTCDSVLLQTDLLCVLVFGTARGVVENRDHLGILRFNGCMLARMGSPNDEGVCRHPLYGRGLQFYSIGEVLNSAWRREIVGQKLFANADRRELRHFIITLKEDTFECLAGGVDASTSEEPLKVVLSRLVAEVAGP
jgi:hypothetical protein